MEYAVNEKQQELILAGCSPVPLASYLKALGVFRLLAEQADPHSGGYWRDDRFVLVTRLDSEAVRRFLLDEYRPTPVLAPWNGGSGFYAGDNQSGIEPLSRAKAARFRLLRESIALAREILGRQQITARPQGQAKARLLAALRGELRDVALEWFDAAILLTEENPKYPPLLGTGGNDGRLDFTNNFMQRLVELFDPDSGSPRPEAGRWLHEALLDRAIPGMESAAVGQFAPGDAGGPNQTTGYEAKALINPWDFVLMIEGAVLFAGAATRRLEGADPGMLSYPFTVRAAGSGSGVSAITDENDARGEIWVPLWSYPTGFAELRSLLGEGRVTVARRQARDGLDFARAVSRLGVDRGIASFQRYAFLRRSGKAYFATPLNRVAARRNPAADLIDELEQSNWLASFRRLARSKNAPNRLVSMARRIEDAIFELALERDNPAAPAERLLVLLGQAQFALGRSPTAREKCPPVPWLSGQWLSRIVAEGDTEVALAAALASIHARGLDTHDGEPGPFHMPMRTHLAPETAGRYPAWDDDAGRAAVWGQRALVDNLGAIVQRRLLDAQRLGLPDKPLYGARAASTAAVAAWLNVDIDERRLEALLPGMTLVRIPRGGRTAESRETPVPMGYRVLKPFFCTTQQLRNCHVLPDDQRLPLPVTLVRLLSTHDVDAAVQRAIPLLRAHGIPFGFRALEPGVTDGRRLLASLLVPLSDYDVQCLLPQPARRQPHSDDPEGATQ